MNGKNEMQTFIYPNMIVRVHFADISEEENNRRISRIKKAATELLKEVRRKA